MSTLLPDGSKAISLGKAQFEAISAALRDFTAEIECETIALAELSGQLIAFDGPMDNQRLVLLLALAAANYSATNEAAKLLGEEKGFEALLQEGEKKSVYVHAVNDSKFLLVIFGKGSNVVKIKHRSSVAAGKILAVFEGTE